MYVATYDCGFYLKTVCTIGGIDLVFVLDVSSSIGSTNFQTIREFTVDIMMSLDIGIQRSLVGVILFSTSANIHFPVTQHTNASILLQELNPGLPYSGGTTNMAAALDLLHTAGQTGGALGLRPGYNNTVIFVTDGASDNRSATLTATSALHESKIYDQIYAVGIRGAITTELNAIGSDPSLVFFASNFDSTTVTALQQDVTQELCNSKLII